MRHRIPALALAFGFLMGLAAQPVRAQNGERLRAWRERREAAMKAKQNDGAAKGQPNVRGMEGLPPKWVENMRDMPPEDQERFMQNNERFKSLPPERQEQIRQNLQRWNSLTPEQQEAARTREQMLEQMTPEQRQYVRNTLLPRWQSMPIERRTVIRRHLARLQAMTPAEQQSALNNPRFLDGLNPDEQSMLRELNSLRNPPAQ
ncbi:MAG TPA: DUF3106 domain-containing protein [Candidatus Acidoferrales bacterium]|nr:DUF3106 domain-containing protein [Candidatus Acidoferrales bacterium]